MSILNVNQIQPVGSGQTITISASDITASSATITASSVTANLTGNVTGNVTSTGNSTFDGNVGINTTNPQAWLDVRGDNSKDVFLGGRNLYVNTDSTSYAAVTIKKVTNGFDYLQLRDASNTLKGQITSDGNWKPIAGGGIDFSATADGSGTTTSELLDDYEEGTFTPTFTGSTTNPTITFINQLGRYTKIGNVCYIEIRMVTSNVSGGSGNLKIGGLPFAQSPDSNLGGAFTKGFVYAWAQDPETFITFGGDSTIYIYRNDSTNTIAQVSDLTSGAANNYLNISGSYITP